MTSVQRVSARVEELLSALKSGGFGAAAPAAEELCGLLVGLYGDGLAQIVSVLGEHGQDGAAILAELADDPLVEGLLLLHDLHPLDVNARIQRALDRVRPYLGSHAGGVQYLGVDEQGIARLRLEGSCHGCPSSAATVELAIAGAVRDAAPEVSDVVVEGMTAPPGPPLLQIGRRPAEVGHEGNAGSRGETPRQPPGQVVWAVLPDVGPPSARPVSATAGGIPVVVCAVRGTLYAYRDACAVCGSSLADGVLDREILSCPGCAARYNVRLAGAAITAVGETGVSATGVSATGAGATGAGETGAGETGAGETVAHLDPLPLLADSQGVRVAVPEAVP